MTSIDEMMLELKQEIEELREQAKQDALVWERWLNQRPTKETENKKEE